MEASKLAPGPSDTLLLYATFDGVATLVHGIGTQALAFMESVAHLRDHGLCDVAVAYPAPVGDCLGYSVDPSVLDRTTELCQDGGIELRPLPFTAETFWSEVAWLELNQALRREVEASLRTYRRVVVIAVDAVFAPAASALESLGSPGTVELVHVLYSTARITGAQKDERREHWEQRCIDAVNSLGWVQVADIGQFFTGHLKSSYGLSAPPLPFRQSVLTRSAELTPLDPDQAGQVLASRGVPQEVRLLIAAGRADPIKGLLDLCKALPLVQPEVHLVMIAVGYHDDDPALCAIRDELTRGGRPHTLHTDFDREFLRALASTTRSIGAVVPSHGEPVGMAPQEIALWARSGGPIVLASDCDGLAEQITHGVDGILFEPGSPESIAAAIDVALSLSDQRRSTMSRRLGERVERERDMDANLHAFLSSLSVLDTEPLIRPNDNRRREP